MRDVRLILEWVGRTLLVGGVLILGFVGYQLWGTNLIEARAQDNLRSEFESRLNETPTTAPAPPDTPTTTTPAVPVPEEGAVAVIKIPSIDVERTVVNGVTSSALRDGPGHYPDTVMPGEIGNAAIAGHRTTYGAPFNRVDELKIGDPIILRTLNGTYTYQVSEEPFVVSPRAVEVLDPASEPVLTLTTCNPKYSAAQRLIVRARLDVTKSPPPRPATPPSNEETRNAAKALRGGGVPVFGLLASLILLGLVGAGWWYLFSRRPKWTTWVLGLLAFLPALLLFYYFLERSLPSTF